MTISTVKHKVRWIDYLNYQKKQLDHAKGLLKQKTNKSLKRQLASLISLVMIDGFAKELYPGEQSVEKRFVRVIKEYAKKHSIKEGKIPLYIYKTFRCTLAHGGYLDSVFLKFYGSQDTITDCGEATGRKGETKSIPTKMIIGVVEDIIKELKKTHKDKTLNLNMRYCDKCKHYSHNRNKKCVFCDN